MSPQVAVVGAGVAGLSTAWFLQELGARVTVLERHQVAAGASWGNAGWLMTGDSSPLTHPDILRHGLRALLDPTSEFAVPWRSDPRLYAFLLRFASNCTARHWRRAMKAYVPLANAALAAYDQLTAAGVTGTFRSSSHLAAFATLPERDGFVRWLEDQRTLGLQSEYDVLDAASTSALSPLVSPAVSGGVALRGQRFLDPSIFVPSLAESVVTRGGVIRAGIEVLSVREGPTSTEVLVAGMPPRIERFDDVVIATGAWISALVHRHGVRVPVRAGRGYSFRARLDVGVDDPVYLAGAHVAATPMRGRLRIAGMMEFRPAEAPLDPRRIRTIVEAARPLLQGVDLDDREDEWVGPRPMSADGMPIVGATATPGVWCIGGHAMEGMALGPVTARLLAEAVMSGRTPDAMVPFDPRR